VSLEFLFSESVFDELDGHLETSSLGVGVDFFSVDLGFDDQVLNESDPFLAFAVGASLSVAAMTSRSSAVVSGECFLHADFIAAHVEGVVLFVVVVSDSVHV